MSIGYRAILATVVSHALASGLFQSVNGHEPKSAPTLSGLTCSVWAGPVTPIATSGLNVTSVRVELIIRLYSNMLAEPADEIDPQLVDAMDTLITAYMGDFTLGGNARAIDVRGSEGEPLRATPGYLTQDSKSYRVFDITMPILINDVWTEAP